MLVKRGNDRRGQDTQREQTDEIKGDVKSMVTSRSGSSPKTSQNSKQGQLNSKSPVGRGVGVNETARQDAMKIRWTNFSTKKKTLREGNSSRSNEKIH